MDGLLAFGVNTTEEQFFSSKYDSVKFSHGKFTLENHTTVHWRELLAAAAKYKATQINKESAELDGIDSTLLYSSSFVVVESSL